MYLALITKNKDCKENYSLFLISFKNLEYILTIDQFKKM